MMSSKESSRLKSPNAKTCIPASYSNYNRLASLVAFMVAFQSPTLASSHRRGNSYRPDTTWMDYSSDNYHHQLQSFENQHSPSSSQLYYSEDEVEERILAALAKADALSSEDYGDASCSPSTSEEAHSFHRHQRRRRSKRRKRKRRAKRQPNDLSPAVSEEGEGTDQLSMTGTSSGARETSDVAKRNDNSSSNSSRTSLEAEDISLREETIGLTRTEHPDLNSRLEGLEAKLQSRKPLGKSYDTWSGKDANPRQWGIRRNPRHEVPIKSGAFVKPSYPPSIHPRRSQEPSDPSSKFVTPPSSPPPPPQTASKVRSRPPASKLRSNQRYPPVPTNRQGVPLSRNKLKSTNPTKLSASKRSATLTSTKDNSVSPWVRKFHSTRPKDCLVLVPREYLLDNFNLARLAPVVEHLATLKQKELETSHSPNLEHNGKSSSVRIRREEQQNNNQLPPPKYAYPIYRQALELILKQPDDTKVEEEHDPSQVVQYAAEVLYTLVHARFVVSPRGLDTIRSRLIVHGSKSINQPLFGRCQRLDCGGMPLLPCGLSDDFDSYIVDQHIINSKAKRYCCNCGETFHCWESKVDGSAWGTSVSHLLLMVYGKFDLFPSHFATPYKKMTSSSECTMGLGSKIAEGELRVGSPGRIFGFPIHPSAAMS